MSSNRKMRSRLHEKDKNDRTGFGRDSAQFKKEVTDHTKSVLEEAIAQGIIVLVATGRPLTGIPGQVRAIQGMQYALTTNGARIYDLIHEKTILSHPVPYEKGKKALEITEKYDTLQEAYFDREVYAQENQLQEIWRYHKNPHMWEYVRSTRTVVPSIVNGMAKQSAMQTNCSLCLRICRI